MERRYDYMIVGSNGFAQVGDPAYWKKDEAEKKVVMAMLEQKFPIPDFVDGWFSWKRFDHEFGPYHEAVLIYDRDAVGSWEDSEDEKDQEKYELFWRWFWEIEKFDFESEFLTELISKGYLNQLDLDRGDHLVLIKSNVA